SDDFSDALVATTSANSNEVASRRKHSYSDEERFTAIAAVRLNGGNVHRTAKALNIPVRTLQDWYTAAELRRARASEYPLEIEKRGDLASKMESLIHDCVESMPTKIGKATLSQSAVTLGILIDKVRILKAQGLEPDPIAEICKAIGIEREQMPDLSELKPEH